MTIIYDYGCKILDGKLYGTWGMFSGGYGMTREVDARDGPQREGGRDLRRGTKLVTHRLYAMYMV